MLGDVVTQHDDHEAHRIAFLDCKPVSSVLAAASYSLGCLGSVRTRPCMGVQAGHEAAERAERRRAGRHGCWGLRCWRLQLQLWLCRYPSLHTLPHGPGRFCHGLSLTVGCHLDVMLAGATLGVGDSIAAPLDHQRVGSRGDAECHVPMTCTSQMTAGGQQGP